MNTIDLMRRVVGRMCALFNRSSIVPTAVFLACLLWGIASYWMTFPGYTGYDPAESLHTWLTPPLADWHPPCYGVLMGILYDMGCYPPMVLNGVSLFLVSLSVWLLFVLLRKRYSFAYLVLLILPLLTLMKFGTVHGKDDLMMGFFLLSIACLFALRPGMGRRRAVVVLGTGIFCLLVVIALRHNGVLLALALTCAAVLRMSFRLRPWRLLLLSFGIPALLFVSVRLGTELCLTIHHTHPASQQQIRDIVAIERLEGIRSPFLKELPDVSEQTLEHFDRLRDDEEKRGDFACLMDNLVQGIHLMPLNDAQSDALTKIWMRRVAGSPMAFLTARSIFILQHLFQTESLPWPSKPILQAVYPKCFVDASRGTPYPISILFFGMMIVLVWGTVSASRRFRSLQGEERLKQLDRLSVGLPGLINFGAYMLVPQGIITRYMWPTEIGMALMLILLLPSWQKEARGLGNCVSIRRSSLLFSGLFACLCLCVYVDYKRVVVKSGGGKTEFAHRI